VLINVSLKMKPKMKLTVLKCSKMFFDDELVELIVRETNTYAAQKYKPEVSFYCFPECGTGNLSLIKRKCMLC